MLNLDAVSVPERDGWMEWRPQGVRQELRASQVGGHPRTAEVVSVSYSRAESRPGGWGARRTVRRSHRDQQRVWVNSLSLRGGETHLPLSPDPPHPRIRRAAGRASVLAGVVKCKGLPPYQ